MASVNKYLEFDSSYRDRTLYPNPASFVIEISQSGQRVRQQAKDPVSNASPIAVWNSSFREDAAATSVSITAIDITFSPSDPVTFIIEAAAGQLRNVVDYYVGAVLILEDAAGVIVRRRILSYERTSTTQAQVTTDIALPNTFPSGALANSSIQNPTNATNTDTVPKVFIPASELIDNFYINYLIQNITTAETFTITAFDGITRLATISGNTAATWAAANNNFVIRKERPINTGVITAINSAAPITSAALATSKAIQLASTAINQSGYYISSYLRMIEPVPTAPFSTLTAPYSQERRIGNYIAGDGIITVHGGAGTNTFTLNPATSSSENGFYVGGLITDSTSGETREVITYNGSTRSGTVAVNWTAGANGDVWTMRTAILTNSFSIPPVVGGADSYELEFYTRDNAVPFVYTGSVVSNQEMVCYEVELLNLVLPNITQSNGRGGRPVFYPYFYVELQNATASSGGIKNVIYSNNPNSYKNLFRAIVDDTTTPLISPFIKIDGDGMVQTIKFNLNDSFKFAVYHPNGELFKTVGTDTTSPTEPNPLLQISASFAVKRISGTT